MADNPFSGAWDDTETAPQPVESQFSPDNPFADAWDTDPADRTDSFGSFARGAAFGVAPAVGGLAGAGAGAASFGAAGFALGGPVGAGIGAFIGGVAGGFGGSVAASQGQEWVIQALPTDWKDSIDEQRALDQEYHPTETFLGGLVPQLLTMKPSFSAAAAKLPANATAFERVLAHPVTGRLFGGAVMGGVELGSEVVSGDAPDWTKIGIATGFGIVFNRQNRLGDKITAFGERAAITGGRAVGVDIKPVFEIPTIAQAADAKVMGPGITEEVFMGTHAQAPEAAMTAQDGARTEASMLGTSKIAAPDVHDVARQMSPETFADYDAMAEQRDTLRDYLGSIGEAPEAAGVRARISQIDVAMREMEPEVSASYRRAADAVESEVVEPEVPAPVAAPETPAAATDPITGAPIEPVPAPAGAAPPIEAQMTFIADDVVRQLVAAGRPVEEAKAIGQLIANRYRTRAGRLGNAMTPQALYQAEGAAVRGVGTKPTLMPTPEAPSIGRVAEAERPAGGVPASELESLDPANIGVDAKRFQFKEGGDESGVTDRLSGVEKWDARLAGTALVFRDEAGKDWIADGHQRLGLAKRLSAAGQQGVKLNAFVLDAKTGVTDSMARAIAAVKNIAEGTGSAVDAAKVLRAAKDSGVDLPPLPPRSALVRDGKALAELSPEAFGIVVNDVVPTSQGAIVGRMVKVPEQQVEALRLLATLKPENVQQAEMIVRDMLSSGTMDGRQESLFGVEDYAASIVLERAKIADEAMKHLRRDKATFKTLIDEAERIQGAGANVLDQATNQSRLSTDEQAAEFLKLLAFRAGPVSDALSSVARKLKTGEIKVGEAARTFLADVRRAVEEGVVDGPDAGGPVAGAGDERLSASDDPEKWRLKTEANAKADAPDRTWKRTGYTVEFRPEKSDPDIFGTLTAVDDDGNVIGDLFFGKNDDRMEGSVEVRPENRRKGIATALYNIGEEITGNKFSPSLPHSADAAAFWERRSNPDATLFQSGRKPDAWKPGDMLGEFETERGQEGFGQSLVPGVKPVSDAERLRAAMAKPLAGGNAPAAPGSLFDAEGRADAADQLTLFQPAPPIDTPEFGRWFKDSKVVDESGAPLVVFHGTDRTFDAFAPNQFFTSSKSVAGTYGKRTEPVYLSIKNPLVVEGGGKDFSQVPQSALFEQAKRDGHDGLIVRNVIDDADGSVTEVADNYIPFDPTQIKSTANRGTFDATDPRILYQPAYHGTPHIFDRFEWSDATRGKGEGAQAFGDGLYFAGNKEVAEYYREALAPADVRIDGRDVPLSDAPTVMGFSGMQKSMALFALRQMRDGSSLEQAIQATKDGYKSLSRPPDLAAFEESFAKQAPTVTAKKGRLYKVDIPDDSELLAWDKPLAEQSPAVREKMAALGFEERKASEWKPREGDAERPIIIDQYGSEIVQNEDGTYSVFGFGADGRSQRIARGDPLTLEQAKAKIDEFNGQQSPTGEQMYRDLSKRLRAAAAEPDLGWGAVGTASAGNDFSGDQAASAALREAGIPGHRFLDQQSRSKGDGTHNYVIYDDSRVNITEYEQGKRGSITFREGRKPLIKLFADADASTFVHETGHQWLEELMRDAVHPQAGDVVKTDAATVRKWLGMEGDKIETRQHEKFARGFEQYMREGTAPSASLARVFAQFKTWLTSIYQSIRGLGAPINEDIRAVFDRMIELEPQRTVVAPEREGVAGISAVHELDAEQAHPANAEPIGDRIAAERQAYIAQQPQEIINELAVAEQAAASAPDLGAEGGAGTAGSAPVLDAGGQPDPLASSSIGGGQPGTLGEGIASGMGESGGAPAGGGAAAGAGLRDQRSGIAGAARPQPLAPAATDIFGPDQSPFVDPAGNIRVENLTTDADVAQAIYDSAAANNDFIGDRRGVVTDGQVLDLAEALGMDAAELNTRKVGQAFNAEQVVAARKLLIQSATDVAAAAKKAATGSDADVMAYAQARSKHQMIQGQIAGITAEAGRALRAFRNIAGQEQAMGVDQFLRNATAKTLFQLKEEAMLAAQIDNPAKVSKFLRDTEKPGFSSMIAEYWINGLVSGPKTHITNLIGNTILAVTKAGPDTAVAALIGAARKAAGRKGEVVHIGEVGAQFGAVARALPGATKAAIDAIRTGRSTLLPGEEVKSGPDLFQTGMTEAAPAATYDEAVTRQEAVADLFGFSKGLLDGLLSVGKMLKAGGERGAPAFGLRRSNLGALPDITVRGVPVLPIGTAVRIPTRMLAAGDSFFRAITYSMEKNAIAYRAAAEEGLSGNAMHAKIAEITMNPSEEIMERSRAEAAQQTLTARRSQFVQLLSRLSNTPVLGLPIMKFFVPFINTPANVIEQVVVHRTPIGLFSPEVRADLMGKNGNVAQDTAMAKMLLGSSVAMGFGTLAAMGYASGSGPSDPEENALWRLAGNQAHSVRIGDTWYQVNQLGPMGILLGISADMYDVAHAAGEGDMLKAGSELLQGFTQNILDASFMTGPSDLIEALQDPDRYGESYIKNFLSSFVPFSGAMGQIARTADPYSRQANDTLAAIKAKVPGLSMELLPRVDIWGEAVPNRTAVGSALVTGIYTQKMATDPVNLAMSQAGYWPGLPDKKIRGVELTDQQYFDYATFAGRMTKKRLDAIVNSGQWNSWPPNVKRDVITEVVRQSRETARGMMMARSPDIAVQATRLKLQSLQQ